MKFYVTNLLIALDQLANAVFGGYPDETISLRSSRACREGRKWGCIMCRVLDTVVKDHCAKTEISKHLSIIARKL